MLVSTLLLVQNYLLNLLITLDCPRGSKVSAAYMGNSLSGCWTIVIQYIIVELDLTVQQLQSCLSWDRSPIMLLTMVTVVSNL